MRHFFLLLLSAYLLSLLQSAAISELLPNALKPDLMVILITYLGTSPLLISGGILVFFSGLLSETFSGSPAGLFPFIYLSIFFLLKLLAKFLILGKTITFRMILVALAMIFQASLITFLPSWLGVSASPLSSRISLVVCQALVTSAVCWPLFQFFKKLESLSQVEPSPLMP